ncbi:hypothetical protein QYS60_19985 [Rhodococcus sp. GXMU-t2271]|uniref:Uncharacterized protein n=1 Tax=Rhodococcus indonesiensis TaxID=3055869 RepID=A0ABT7RSQ0_9NOCA|nr:MULTISPECIES: hypothetical protein [Rhodococcus]MDM7490678.1 hypothetical protein [Rhodococcus indonesiensis]
MHHHDYPIFLQPGEPTDRDRTTDVDALPRSQGPHDYSGLFSSPN